MVFFIHNRDYILSIGLVMWRATGQKILENRQKMPKSKTENAREQQVRKCSSFSRKNIEFFRIFKLSEQYIKSSVNHKLPSVCRINATFLKKSTIKLTRTKKYFQLLLNLRNF